MSTINGWPSNQTFYDLPGRHEAYMEARSYIESLISTNYSGSSARISAAINFLGMAASNEQQKEIDSIREWALSLQKDLKNYNENSPLAQIIKNPQAKIEDLMGFYTELTLAINKDRQGMEETKKNLSRIINNVNAAKTEARNVYNYFQQDYRFAVAHQLSTFTKRLLGDYGKNTIDESEFTPKIQRIALEALVDLGITQKMGSPENFIAIASTMLADLSSRAQIELDKILEKEPRATFKDLSNEVVNAIKEKYVKELKDNDPQSTIQHLISDVMHDVDSPELELALSNTKKILGIKQGSNSLKDQRLKSLKSKYRGRSEKSGLEAQILNFSDAVQQNPILQDSLYKITFTNIEKSTSAFGDTNELIQGLLKKKISENVATDLVTYKINFEIKKDEKRMTDFLTSIDTALSSSLKERTKMSEQTDLKQISGILEKMNRELVNINNQIEDFLDASDNFSNKKVFIYHESLKLSSQAD